MKTVFSVMLAFPLIGFCEPILADAPAPDSIGLEVRIYENHPALDKPRVRSGSQVFGPLDKPLRFYTSFPVKSEMQDAEHDIGTRYEATVTHRGEDLYELKLQLRLCELSSLRQEPDTELFLQHTYDLVAHLEIGKAKKVLLSPTRWMFVGITGPNQKLIGMPELSPHPKNNKRPVPSAVPNGEPFRAPRSEVQPP